MKRDIIFINRYFYPDYSATSQLLTDLAFHLAEQGSNVIIITSRQLIDNPQAYLKKIEIANGVCIKRITTTYFGRTNLLGRAIDYCSFYVSAFIELWRVTKKDDVIVAKTDPPLISIVAAIVVRLRGAALINWLQDLFPEVAISLDIKMIRFLSPILFPLRNYSIQLARTNIVLGERMAELVKQQTAGRANTIIIHNWSDGQIVHPISHNRNPLRQEWGLEGKFVVGYSGNMGRAHEFDTIIGAIERLKSVPNLIFLFIGAGAQQEAIKQQAIDRNLRNIIFKPYQSRERLAKSLSCADVHLISLIPELEGMIVPSKFYGIAAAGRATLFIGDSDGEIVRIITRNKCGLAFGLGESQRLADTLLALSTDPKRCANLGTRARQTFNANYDKLVALDEFTKLLKGNNGSG